MCERRKMFKMAWNQQIVYGRTTCSPRRCSGLRLRTEKNLHIPSGYALSILLHKICLQAMH
ncbi:hypothetical protein T4B_6067, partial [Trichinella pseudospiralis]